MKAQENARASSFVGPSGSIMHLDDLPPPNTRRWVARRKAEVVAAVRANLLTFEDACRRYNISEEEFRSWERLIDRHGLNGLRVTQLQRLARHPGSDAAL